jgi:hypothetical protein
MVERAEAAGKTLSEWTRARLLDEDLGHDAPSPGDAGRTGP